MGNHYVRPTKNNFIYVSGDTIIRHNQTQSDTIRVWSFLQLVAKTAYDLQNSRGVYTWGTEPGLAPFLPIMTNTLRSPSVVTSSFPAPNDTSARFAGTVRFLEKPSEPATSTWKGKKKRKRNGNKKGKVSRKLEGEKTIPTKHVKMFVFYSFTAAETIPH